MAAEGKEAGAVMPSRGVSNVEAAGIGYLTCAHCGCEFLGSRRQQKRARSKVGPTHRFYCSRICQDAGTSKLRTKPLMLRGPCPTCKQEFHSRTAKIYCGMKCYMSSPDFLKRLREIGERGSRARILKQTGAEPKPRVEVECIECGKKEIVRFSIRNRKTCGRPCYRRYFAKRFDRWMANPETIALPQAYDEFMLQDELPCLIEGCGWTGKSLGFHVNVAHGITAEEFKRAAGFNKTTGLVTVETHERMSVRSLKTLKMYEDLGTPLLQFPNEDIPRLVRNYRSKEGKEHYQKARALMAASGGGRTVKCQGCGITFRTGPIGKHAQFCNTTCRAKVYSCRSKANYRKGKIYELTCSQCGERFSGTRRQYVRSGDGQFIACSLRCRQTRAGSMPKRCPVEDPDAP